MIEAGSATAGSFVGLLVFLFGTVTAITVSIISGYILEHRKTRKEKQEKRQEGTEWRTTGRRPRRRRARG